MSERTDQEKLLSCLEAVPKGSESDPEAVLARLARAYADGAARLSGDYVSGEDLPAAAVREAIWALYHAFPDYRMELVAHLDDMVTIVRSQAVDGGDGAG
jgi:hypothetical protein